jgi:hypothetical protein
MGVTQFWQGVETVRALTSLAMLTGNLGKAHVGVNPVRGQNNVQGACDMGALPDVYPGYQSVTLPENRDKFANAWGVESLPDKPGYRISELPHRAAHGEVRAAWIMGEDPLQTDAELSAVRKAFETLELVIVQDIFMTKTAAAAADWACWPDDSGNRQHNQRHDFQWRKKVTHGVQQFARIKGNQNHNGEVDQAVDKQRHFTATGQRGDAHFEGDGSGTRGCKQRADRQVAHGRQQNASHFANWGTEAINTAADFRQCHNGQHWQTHGSNQESKRSRPDVFTRL